MPQNVTWPGDQPVGQRKWLPGGYGCSPELAMLSGWDLRKGECWFPDHALPGQLEMAAPVPPNQLPAPATLDHKAPDALSTAGASCGCEDPEVLSPAQGRTYLAGGLPVPLLQPQSVPVAFSSLSCAWTGPADPDLCIVGRKINNAVLFFWLDLVLHPPAPHTHTCTQDTQAHTDI